MGDKVHGNVIIAIILIIAILEITKKKVHGYFHGGNIFSTLICYNRFPLQNRYPVLCERNFKVLSKVDRIQTYSIKFFQLSGRCIQFATLTRRLLGLSQVELFVGPI